MLDLSSPIKSSIFLYIFMIIALIIYKPKLIKDKRRSQLFSIAVIVISILSYYLLAILKLLSGK
jgi:amino acid permease